MTTIHYRIRPGWKRYCCPSRSLGRCPCRTKAHLRRSSFCLLLILFVVSFSIFRLLRFRCPRPAASGPTQTILVPLAAVPSQSTASASFASELPDWRPPLVHRSILGKLASLEEEEEIASSLGTERLMTSEKSDTWPPRVTRIPDEVALPSGTAADRDLELDYALCNASPCRLLLPAFINEQESKARLHLGQLVHLARALGRTLVLPNVGRGRISTCSKWDFGFYYDVSALEDDGTAAINFTSFRRWVALRARRPDAQLVTLLPPSTSQEEDEVPLEQDSAANQAILGSDATEVFVAHSADPAKATHSHCLQGRAHNLRFGRFSPLQLRPTLKQHHCHLSDQTTDGALYRDFGRGVVKALSSTRALRESAREKRRKLLEPDVLVVIWELQHPIFPSPAASTSFDALQYSDRLSSLAQAVSERLQTFVAVYWSMGSVYPPSSLHDCIAFLASSLATLLSQHGLLTQVKSVYLATGHEADGQEDPRLSNTFEAVRDYHRHAVQLLNASVKHKPSLAGVRLTDLASELDSSGLVREEIRPDVLDSGLVDIIDKMVMKNAALFISGARECGRTSPFTEQIVEDRKRARAAGIRLFNEVELFG